MSQFARLLRYSRPYTGFLLMSVVLMACVGAAQGLTVRLIGPIFDRVLNPASPDSPVRLFTIPGWNYQVYLDNFMPASIHNVWTMVATGILAMFAIKGLCDYAGNYLVNYVGLSAVTDLRQDVFDRVVHQDAHFFEPYRHNLSVELDVLGTSRRGRQPRRPWSRDLSCRRQRSA